VMGTDVVGSSINTAFSWKGVKNVVSVQPCNGTALNWYKAIINSPPHAWLFEPRHPMDSQAISGSLLAVGEIDGPHPISRM